MSSQHSTKLQTTEMLTLSAFPTSTGQSCSPLQKWNCRIKWVKRITHMYICVRVFCVCEKWVARDNRQRRRRRRSVGISLFRSGETPLPATTRGRRFLRKRGEERRHLRKESRCRKKPRDELFSMTARIAASLSLSFFPFFFLSGYETRRDSGSRSRSASLRIWLSAKLRFFACVFIPLPNIYLSQNAQMSPNLTLKVLNGHFIDCFYFSD